MNPPDAHSSLAALRQLKEMLDAGTITPPEFETLKRQLIFGQEPALPLPTAADGQVTLPLADAGGDPLPEVPAPLPESTSAAYDAVAPNPAGLAPPPPAAAPDWLAAPAPGLLPDEPAPPAEERRNPLNLVFLVGGALVLLGIVLYLFIGRPTAPDEHLASGSQTAADSVAVAPEVGPQVEQITLPPVAAPETVRVAPVVRPAAAPAASQFRADSVAAAPASAAANSIPAAPAPAKPAAAPVKTAPVAAPAAVDSAGRP